MPKGILRIIFKTGQPSWLSWRPGYMLLLISIALSYPPESWSSPAQVPDSLSAYIESAVKNNPVVIQRYYEYRAALEKIPQAGSLPDPELSAGVFLSPMELSGGRQAAELKLMQMFPWFGVLRNAKDEMSMMAMAKFEQLRDARLQTVYEVRRTWYELQKLQKEILITESNLDILKVIYQLAFARYGVSSVTPEESLMTKKGKEKEYNQGNTDRGQAGMTGMKSAVTGQGSGQAPDQTMSQNTMATQTNGSGLTDLYLIISEEKETEYKIETLRSKMSSVKARFNSLMNRPVFSEICLISSAKHDTNYFQSNMIIDSTTAGNPMLAMVEYEKKSFEARKKMARSMGYPMVGFGLEYSLINKSSYSMSAMNGRDMVMPMVSVTMPIYRKKYNAIANEADLMISAASAGYQANANSLQADLTEAFNLYQDAIKRKKLYEELSDLTSKSLDLLIKNMSVASADLPGLLRTRQKLLDYKLNETEAEADINSSAALINKLNASDQVQ